MPAHLSLNPKQKIAFSRTPKYKYEWATLHRTYSNGKCDIQTYSWDGKHSRVSASFCCQRLQFPSPFPFFDFEVGGHDGAYKGRIHAIVPFIGRKNGALTA